MATTIKEKITGLYIAFFDRAPDKNGLEYWEKQASIFGEDEAVKKLAQGFASHPKFTDLYSNLSNQEFVESIYKNTLGSAGDKDGIEYWTNQLNNGLSRSDMVADFISISLDFNPNSSQYSSLSKEDIDLALQRQDFISNKTDVSLKYVELLGDKTNLSPNTDITDPISLENDLAYKASIKIIKDVTDNENSVKKVIDGLELIKDKDEAIYIIDKAENIDVESISYVIEHLYDPNLKSNINNGLGDLDFNNLYTNTLDSGYHWDKDIVTFSFNETMPDSYEVDEKEVGWEPLNEEQRDAVRTITSEVNNLLNIELREVEDNGDIRFNLANMEDGVAGFSFYPAEEPDYMGDVVLSTAFNSDPKNYGLEVGEGGWGTITHELGHALGLKHPADYNDETPPPYLPNELNDTNHTVMSYTTRDDIVPHFIVNGNKITADLDIVYPELYSIYDIATLQSIYGANKNYHTEDNRYTLEYSEHKIETIWDAGGNDTIDLSNTKGNTTLNMSGGTINSVDVYSLDDIISIYQEDVHSQGMNINDADNWIAEKITYLYNEDLLYTGKNNFSIAQGVIIENINTGAGDDIITDNEVDNIINTGAGDDKIYLGNGGFDHINGGDGNDSIYLNLSEEDVKIDKIDNQTYSIMADNFYAEIEDIETIYFTSISHIDLI